MDLVFYTTILVIFATAIVGPFVRSRLRDRCLRSLDESLVVLERVDQDPVWGRLRVYATGLELLYGAPSPGISGIDKYSYILYKGSFGAIHALWRYPDEMTEDERRRRAKRIRRTARPPFYLRFTPVVITPEFTQSLARACPEFIQSLSGVYPRLLLT